MPSRSHLIDLNPDKAHTTQILDRDINDNNGLLDVVDLPLSSQ